MEIFLIFVVLATLLLSLCLGILLMYHTPKITTKFLAAYFTFVAVKYFFYVIAIYTAGVPTALYVTPDIINFSLPIFIYLYFFSLSGKKLVSKHWLFIVPLLLYIGYWEIRFYGYEYPNYKVFVDKNKNFTDEVIGLLYYLPFIIAIHRLSEEISRYDTPLAGNDTKVKVFLVRLFNAYLMLFAISGLVLGMLKNLISKDNEFVLVSFLLVVYVFQLILVVVTAYLFLKNREIFSEPTLYSSADFQTNHSITLLEATQQLSLYTPHIAKKSLTESLSITNKIEQLIKSEKIFLDPNLTIKQFAERLEMNLTEASKLINQYYHKNFNEFINDYRIEEARQILADNDQVSKTLSHVAQDAGFKSESNFYFLFKKITGNTPHQYRTQAQKAAKNNSLVQNNLS
jgi:AraC-like DNA-binding protein